MKDSIKMIAAIVVFATVACVGLAFVYDKTAPAISENQKKTLKEAQKEVFPKADSFDVIWDGTSGTVNPVVPGNPAAKFSAEYAAKKDGEVIGIAITSASFGFNADITALVGIDIEGKITGVKILSNTDTPGLGANASNDKYFVNKDKKLTFYGQFTGMSKDSNITVVKDGGEVTAITAATISSRAVSLLVREAASAGYKWLANNGATGTAWSEGAGEETSIPGAQLPVPDDNGGSN